MSFPVRLGNYAGILYTKQYDGKSKENVKHIKYISVKVN